jgi:pyridoxamine 5'-phosphate oxidase
MRDIPPVTAHPPLALADLTDAAGTWARLGRWLHAGATTPTHAFRWPVVSSVAADGGPDSRIVVLRRFDPAARLLVFHTDVRSAKVADLRRNPRCGFLFYEPDDRLQLRVRTAATLHHADEFARREFDAQSPFNRASYAGAGVPGANEPADAPFDYPPKPPVDEAVAFGHFLAVACVIERIDALELQPSGHRRAVVEWVNGEVRMRRVGA